jgi:hypothetical protein
MKYFSFLFLLLVINNFIIAMEVKPTSLASFFDIDNFCAEKQIVHDIARYYVSDKQWWYVDREIQFHHCNGATDWDKKNGIDFVYFNKTGTEIIADPLGYIQNCSMCLWDRRTGKELQRVDWNYLNSVIFCNKDAQWTDRLRLLDPRSNMPNPYYCTGAADRLLFKEFGKKCIISFKKGISFSRAKTVLVISDNQLHDSIVHLWDKQAGKTLFQLKHDLKVNDVCFNQQETEILTASNDCTVRLWHGITGKELLRITYDTCVKAAAFNDLGTEIVVGTDKGKIQILAKYYTNNLQQILLKKLLHVWLQLEKPSKQINSPGKLLKTIAKLLWCNREELRRTWLSFPENMRKAIWLSMYKKIQTYGK